MKIYFASDLHLGTPTREASRQRELLFVQWLDVVAKDADEVFLVGDVFDFWHEYNTVVPKGFVRLLGKIAELSDKGIKVHVFTGNHDLWMQGYLQEELGAIIHYAPIEREWNGKKFFIGHGDGLGPGDKGYKRMKRLFTNPLARWAFKWLHPDIGVKVAQYFSKQSRYGSGNNTLEKFKGEGKEWLVQYCKKKLQQKHFDYFIFGHRHLPLNIKVGETSTYINLGDWLHYNTYAVFDGETTKLLEFGK
jgi:UDP-2,3-diacylglucosamine hydrolase